MALNLTWGNIFGNFNGKIAFIIAVVIFEVGSAVCGAAPTMNAELVGRAICGVGGMGIYMGALNLIANATSDAERPVYISLMGLGWALGTVLGPVIGGAFAESSATWRWSFYINLVIGGVCAPAYIFLLPSTNRHLQSENFWKRLRSLDWVGTVLVAGASTSGIMGISFGGAVYPWRSGEIIGCFCCSGVLWIMFCLQQAYAIFTTPADRIFPCKFLSNIEAVVLFLQSGVAFGSNVATIYLIPLHFQFVQWDEPLDAGIRLLPFIFLCVFGVLLTGALLGKGIPFLPMALIGGILVVIGGALMHSLVTVDTSTSSIYGFTVLLGLGFGLHVMGCISVVQSLFPPERVAEATAFVGFGQLLGLIIWLAIVNAVFINAATEGIVDVLPQAPLTQIHAVLAGADSALFQQLDDGTRRMVLDAIVSSLKTSYILVIVSGAVVVVLCPFLKWKKSNM